MVDFASYIGILVMLGIALLDIGIIPIRYGEVQNTAAQIVHSLALKKTLSAAVHELYNGLTIPPTLAALEGVHIKHTKLNLIINSVNRTKIISLDAPRDQIPSDWLPDGSSQPCQYLLNLRIEVDIDPLMNTTIAGMQITGLNSPISFTVNESSQWENLGRDPASQLFYLSE